jgi:hypothetical protein
VASNPFDTAWQQCVAWARQVESWVAGGPATAAGYATAPGYTHSSTPAPGDVAVWPAGVAGSDPSSGHIAVVTEVDASGFTVSQTNWPEGSGAVTMRVPATLESLLTFLAPPAGQEAQSAQLAAESALGLPSTSTLSSIAGDTGNLSANSGGVQTPGQPASSSSGQGFDWNPADWAGTAAGWAGGVLGTVAGNAAGAAAGATAAGAITGVTAASTSFWDRFGKGAFTRDALPLVVGVIVVLLVLGAGGRKQAGQTVVNVGQGAASGAQARGAEGAAPEAGGAAEGAGAAAVA